MNKTLAASTALVLALGGVALTATSAQATHPQVSGVAVCDTTTGDNVITWTVSGDPGYPDVAGTFTSASRVADQIVGKTVTGGQTITATERLQPNVRSLELTVGIQFANHSRGDIVTNRGSVRLVDCVRDIPTQPADFDEPYSTTTGDCSTLEHVTTGGTRHHAFTFDPASWSWVETVTDTVNEPVTVPFNDDELADCAGAKPEDRVAVTEWVDGEVACGDTARTDSRTMTTSVATRNGAVWTFGEPVTVTETRTVDVEPTDCPVVTDPPTVTPPAPVAVVERVPALVTTGSDWTSTFGPWIAGAAFLGIIAGVIGLVRSSKRQRA